MPQTRIDQLLQVHPSATYDDVVASVHTIGVAEGQTHLEGDLNVLRSIVKDALGETNWYDTPTMALKPAVTKMFLEPVSTAAMADVTITGGSTSAFDAAIKDITNHDLGVGSSVLEGVVVNATLSHRLAIRDHDSQDVFDDGSGNEVYGRLSWSSTPVEAGDDNNQLSGWANVTGVDETNTDSDYKQYVSIIDDTGGFFHIEFYSDVARTQLIAHTATYNSTGAKALVADNASGMGGTITVDAVTAADADISILYGGYVVTFYSWKAGVETAYTFTGSEDADLAYVLVSRAYKDLAWDRFIDFGWHDQSGIVGSITDDVVVVDGMTDLYSGLTTQAQVNAKGDDLGSTATGEGASLIAIEDPDSYYTGTDIEAALDELKDQIGGATSATYDFSEANVLTDDDAVYAALEKLDLKWGDLASTATGEGASLVGIEDAGDYTAQTDVEGALQEIYGLVADIEPTKVQYTTPSPITSGTNWTLPSSLTYTLGTGANLDVYFNGELLMEGASNDYQEVSTTQIKFNFTVPTNRNIVLVARK